MGGGNRCEYSRSQNGHHVRNNELAEIVLCQLLCFFLLKEVARQNKKQWHVETEDQFEQTVTYTITMTYKHEDDSQSFCYIYC